MIAAFPSLNRLLAGLWRPLLFSLFLSGPLRAQLGGFYALGEGLPFAAPVYAVDPVTDGRQNFENQLNLRGAAGQLRLAPLYFTSGSPAQGNVYFGGTSAETATWTFEVLPVPPGDTAVFLTRVNSQGAAGFRFYGAEYTSLNPPEQSHVFVRKSGPSSVYVYVLEPQASSAQAFLALLNTRGQDGWQWISTLAADGLNPLAFHELFVRKVDSPARFTYRLPSAASGAAAALAEMNAQGQEGFRWLGPFSFGTFPQNDSREIYQKDSSGTELYQYELPAGTSSAADFKIQADNRGTEGFTFVGPVIYQAEPAAIRHVYIRHRAAPEPVESPGTLTINGAGRVSFVPNAVFARFQLYTSGNLGTWETWGDPQSAAVGETIFWDTGIPAAPGRRFFRVQGIPRIAAP